MKTSKITRGTIWAGKRRRNTAIIAAAAFCALALLLTAMPSIGALAAVRNQIDGPGGKKHFNTSGGEVLGDVTDEDDWAVSLSKTIAPMKDGMSGNSIENEFEITLRVEAAIDSSAVIIYPDALTILVIDVSGSMTRNELFQPSNRTRMKAAEDTATEFITGYADVGGAAGVVRGLAVVKFGSDVTGLLGWTDVASNKTPGVNAVKNLGNSDVSAGTNVAGGLRYANNLLNTVPVWGNGITNVHVILISDGGPTCASIAAATTITTNSLGTQIGRDTNLAVTSGLMRFNFGTTNVRGEGTWNAAKTAIVTPSVNVIDSTIVTSGTATWNNSLDARTNHYRDNAIYALREAHLLRARTTFKPIIHAIGFTTQNYSRSEREYWAFHSAAVPAGHPANTNTSAPVLANLDAMDGTGLAAAAERDAIGANMSVENFLKSVSSNSFFDASNDIELQGALDYILKIIETTRRPVIMDVMDVIDPMAPYIAYGGITENIDEDTVKFADASETLAWDIASATPINIRTAIRDEIDYYIFTYEIKYKITLDNLTTFEEHGIYTALSVVPTNGTTTFTYVVDDGEPIKQEFPIPEVHGFAGDLSFIKINAGDSRPLRGARFALSKGDYVQTAESDSEGLVRFKGIPSGHMYTLKETKPPDDYVHDTTEYTVTVSFGEVTVSPMLDTDGEDLLFKNTPRPPEPPIEKGDNTLVIHKYGVVDLDGTDGVGLYAFDELPEDAFPLGGITFRLYRIGLAAHSGAPPDDLHFALDDPESPAKLYSPEADTVNYYPLIPVGSDTTDEDGLAGFEELEDALYLLVELASKGVTAISPCIIQLPPMEDSETLTETHIYPLNEAPANGQDVFPETGGIGEKILYGLGAAVVFASAAGTVIYLRRRRTRRLLPMDK